MKGGGRGERIGGGEGARESEGKMGEIVRGDQWRRAGSRKRNRKSSFRIIEQGEKIGMRIKLVNNNKY